MKRTVLFIHSAGSQRPPEGSSGLVAHLRSTLKGRYRLLAPRMPQPDAPEYPRWRAKIAPVLAALEPGAILVGHSLGGSVLVKLLAESPRLRRFGALFLVAAPYWGKRQGWNVDGFLLPANLSRRLPGAMPVTLFHSQEDPFVPFRHLQLYRKALPRAASHPIRGGDHVFAAGVPGLVEAIGAVAEVPGIPPRRPGRKQVPRTAARSRTHALSKGAQ